jgi:hypothetical protein
MAIDRNRYKKIQNKDRNGKKGIEIRKEQKKRK